MDTAEATVIRSAALTWSVVAMLAVALGALLLAAFRRSSRCSPICKDLHRSGWLLWREHATSCPNHPPRQTRSTPD